MNNPGANNVPKYLNNVLKTAFGINPETTPRAVPFKIMLRKSFTDFGINILLFLCFNEYNKYNNTKSKKSKEFFENFLIFSFYIVIKCIQRKEDS